MKTGQWELSLSFILSSLIAMLNHRVHLTWPQMEWIKQWVRFLAVFPGSPSMRDLSFNADGTPAEITSWTRWHFFSISSFRRAFPMDIRHKKPLHCIQVIFYFYMYYFSPDSLISHIECHGRSFVYGSAPSAFLTHFLPWKDHKILDCGSWLKFSKKK